MKISAIDVDGYLFYVTFCKYISFHETLPYKNFLCSKFHKFSKWFFLLKIQSERNCCAIIFQTRKLFPVCFSLFWNNVSDAPSIKFRSNVANLLNVVKNLVPSNLLNIGCFGAKPKTQSGTFVLKISSQRICLEIIFQNRKFRVCFSCTWKLLNGSLGARD